MAHCSAIRTPSIPGGSTADLEDWTTCIDISPLNSAAHASVPLLARSAAVLPDAHAL